MLRPGDGVRLLAAAAPRPDGQHPHQPRGEQRHGSRSSAATRSGRTSTSTTWRPVPADAGRAADEPIAGKVFNAGYENHTVSEHRRDGARRRRALDRDRHDADRRQPLVPHLVGEDPARARASCRRTRSRTRRAGWSRRSAPAAIPNPMTDIRYYNIKTMQALQPEVTCAVASVPCCCMASRSSRRVLDCMSSGGDCAGPAPFVPGCRRSPSFPGRRTGRGLAAGGETAARARLPPTRWVMAGGDAAARVGARRSTSSATR